MAEIIRFGVKNNFLVLLPEAKRIILQTNFTNGHNKERIKFFNTPGTLTQDESIDTLLKPAVSIICSAEKLLRTTS